MTDSQPKYLGVRETALRLGVHENTIRNWVRDGTLRSARLPGTRSHRFDERDVERLRGHRGEPVVSVATDLRTIGPELIDAAQLERWASDIVDARHVFPDLMRRLFVSTPGMSRISVRTGTGNSLPGWDGQASAVGVPFLPDGELLFEFGVGGRPKVKADSDYDERTRDPRGEDLATATFVFVTPRRWRDGSKWAAARRAEGVFRDVRVLDADDLEGWLQASPAVHYWLSEELGRRPHDAQTLDSWWTSFRSQTLPPLPDSLFLAGRDGERKRLLLALRSDPSVIPVRAASRNDALAFVSVVISNDDLGALRGKQPLVVKSADAWNRIVRQHGVMVLIPLFPDVDTTIAISNGHHVVLVSDRTAPSTGSAIELPIFDREAAHAALQAAGIEFKEAHRLAALARRSFPAFVRDLAPNPQLLMPAWSTDATSRSVLAPLVLVTEWTESEADHAILEAVTSTPWPEIERTLLRWSRIDDPPFIQSGTLWHLASAEEAFRVLSPHISSTDWQRWREVALEVLLEADPTLEIPPDQRPMAGLLGVRRTYSRTVRSGIACGIAVAGASDLDSAATPTTPGDQARQVVRSLLRRANEDGSGSTWCALADVLPFLAEAAPHVFLEAVHHDLERPSPTLAVVFQDRNRSAFMSSSPHTGLLWALETLCWSPSFLLEACRALARLDQLDHPRGTWANRPIESLASVLVGWVRQTSASLDERVTTIDTICRETPDTGWLLLMKLWPESQATCIPPASPRFRGDWKPDGDRVPTLEYARFVSELIRLALKYAGTHAEHWADLAERVSTVAPNDQVTVLNFLEKVATPERLAPESRTRLWERLHAYVASHRRFAKAAWALRGPALDRLDALARRFEPEDVLRFAYLFDWHPDLADVPPEDHDTYSRRLQELREEAARSAIEGGIPTIATLAQRSPVPSHFGWTVADVSSATLSPNLTEWLDSADWNLRETAGSWATRQIQRHGPAWLRDTFSRPELQVEPRRVALALAAPQSSEMWALLKELDPGLHDRYWREANVWRVDPADIEPAARELLDHGRPRAAVPLLARNIRKAEGGSGELPPKLVREVLSALAGAPIPTRRDQSLGYEVGRLLDYLESVDADSPDLVAFEFVLFQLLEHHRQPRALRRALSREPGFFVELVKRVYRSRSEPERELEPAEAIMARHSWFILHEGGFLPGMRDDGSIDEEKLRDWVTEARRSLNDVDRAEIGDEEIGRALSSSPIGSDGVWPAEAVRRVVESVASSRLEAGLCLGVINARGMTSRGPYDGGAQESELAAKYLDWSRRTETEWRRTSRLLRRIGEDYEREARDEDLRARRSGDRD